MAGFHSGYFNADAIVVDLDGVLVDTMPAIRAAWAEWARLRGISAEEVLSEIHRTGEELIRKFAPTADPFAEAQSIAARQAMRPTFFVALEGAAELIGSLPPDRWAIVTSARREPALRHLAMARLPAPNTLISAEDTPRGKPDPAGYRLAAKRLAVSPKACLAIDDSPAGLRAALDAGMVAIGITNTHDALELPGAHAVIESLRDLRVTPDATGKILRVESISRSRS